MKREIEDTRRQRKYMLRDRNPSKEARRSVIKKYNAYIADQQNKMREYMERSRVHPNLR